MLGSEVQVGDYVRYWLSEERDPQDRRLWVTRWAHAEVLAIKPQRVKIRLVHLPEARVRWVGTWRLM